MEGTSIAVVDVVVVVVVVVVDDVVDVEKEEVVAGSHERKPIGHPDPTTTVTQTPEL